MAVDNILRSFADVSIKQDVVGLIEIISARETYFLNSLGKTVAISTIHNTQIDTLDADGSAAVGEGDDLTALAQSTPTFLTNLVEKVAKPFKVSRTQQLVQHYVGVNELARQTTKALMNWGKAAEFDIVRSTLVSGASGTTQKMGGIIFATSKSTNHTSHNSGTVFSASILNGLMKNAVDNSNGDVGTELFVGSWLRNVIDGFTQKSNSLVSVPSNSIENAIDIYQTSFGRIAVHYHRLVQQSGDATGRVLTVRPDSLKIAYLRKPFVDTELQRAGDYDFRSVLGDLTVEVKNQDSTWYADGFDID